MVLLLSFLFVGKTIGLSEPIQRGYLPFFFLGSGFMLVETKAITELGLHLGGTWIVVAATIVMVLVMAYLANEIVMRKLFPRTEFAYVGLVVSLLAGYAYSLNHEWLAFSSHWANLAVSGVVLTIPLFFSGIVFSNLIGKAKVNVSTALAYNLMGALFGGLMEYNSMYFGFAFLYLLAVGFYVLAWAFSWDAAMSRTWRQLGVADHTHAFAKSVKRSWRRLDLAGHAFEATQAVSDYASDLAADARKGWRQMRRDVEDTVEVWRKAIKKNWRKSIRQSRGVRSGWVKAASQQVRSLVAPFGL
jgi:hypothetical protein